MTSLLVISSARAALTNGKLYLNTKFVEGMRRYSDLWDGPVSCIVRKRDEPVPFGDFYTVDQLPFDLTLLPANTTVGAEMIAGHDIILCSGDNHEYLPVADMSRSARSKLVFVIEYIPETRRQIIFLDPSSNVPKKVVSLLWTMRQEQRRRRAFRKADGIQANGYPAFSAYDPLNSNTMMYLDNRVGENLLATKAEMEAREKRVMSGAPLRLLHSGRLEHLKGSQDLIPIARRLVSKGIDFTLDIFGTGSLEEEIRRGISEHGLQNRVKLNGAVDFETELVPFARQHADIYLSCHRQSDPSCSYIENMGCGLAVIGYANRMWAALCRDSGAGWVAAMGKADDLAETVVQAVNEPERLLACCRAAYKFASNHSFEHEFEKRVNHLIRLS